ncbi:alpha/beta hydrolase family protein [Paenibacillus popilliae]|uniref:Carboxylic ester hydrolase n=1 Tax=Paenibacillus popilliae TaxID=78057 RepID=A0ABY3AUV4_PAEPP|nr:carboxylic ester hydrolase [Paenibacillus sp. SDF0028]TQR46513.1 carboxylic ester hydrolase [Paenibacillus sp. SDF0028]
MRLIEILLSFANLLAFLVLIVPMPHRVRWKGPAILATLCIAIAQVLIEGPRWQMAPAYALAVLFLLIRLLQSSIQARGSAKPILMNRFISVFSITLGIIGIGISVALPIIFPVFHFPRPSGPYEIGTVTYHWTDVSRHEVFGSDKSAHRDLMVQVWYPSKEGSTISYAPYLQNSSTVPTALARLHNFPEFSLIHLKYVNTNSSSSIATANDKYNYPVLLFLEGLTGYRQMNTYQVEELVSHGYIVVGIDQPGVAASVTFPDGRQIMGLSKPQMDSLREPGRSTAKQLRLLNTREIKDGVIPYFAKDISFVLNQLESINSNDPNNILTGKLDLQHTGILGVSFGGTVGAEACLKDSRLKACLIMDVDMTADVVQKGLQQPSMWITRDADTMRLERQKAGGWTEKDIEITQTTMRAVYNSLPGDGYFVQVPGMFHADLTDLTNISPISSKFGLGGPIGRRAHNIINAYSVAFFNQHLKSTPTTLLDRTSKQFHEVIFETRKP